MAKSNIRLDTRRALKDGTYPVQICVGYGTNIYLATGIFLKPDEWDATTKQCIGKGARKINNVLQMLLMQVSNRILELREMFHGEEGKSGEIYHGKQEIYHGEQEIYHGEEKIYHALSRDSLIAELPEELKRKIFYLSSIW